MVMLNEKDSSVPGKWNFKTHDERRAHRGVYVAFLKQGLDELDIDDLDSDYESDDQDEPEPDNDDDMNVLFKKQLVAYLVYQKQEDELESVCIREVSCLIFDPSYSWNINVMYHYADFR